MKKIIGWLIITFMVIGLYVATSITYGWMINTLIWFASIGVVVVLEVAIGFINDDKKK